MFSPTKVSCYCLVAAVLLCAPMASQGDSLPYYDTVLADSPVGYWRLGETGSTTAVDSSTGGHNGAVQPTGVDLGNTAGALSGDPSNLAATFIGEVPNGSGYGIHAGNGTSVGNYNVGDAFTVEAWVKTTSTASMGVVSKYNSGVGWFVNVHNGHLYVQQQDAGGWGAQYSDAAPLADGNWHYVAFTHSPGGASSNLIEYIDGVLASSSPAAVGTSPGPATSITTSGSMVIGRQFPWTSSDFVGAIDEVAIYNTVLTGDQIAAHFAAASVPVVPEPSTLALLATGLVGLLAYAWRKRK